MLLLCFYYILLFIFFGYYLISSYCCAVFVHKIRRVVIMAHYYYRSYRSYCQSQNVNKFCELWFVVQQIEVMQFGLVAHLLSPITNILDTEPTFVVR